MTAFDDQFRVDMAAILADPYGPTRQMAIGSSTPRAIVGDTSLEAAGEGLLEERQVVHCLAGDLGFVPVTGQELVVEGARWRVESCPPAEVLSIHLLRYRT
jgi:hypothetical protein